MTLKLTQRVNPLLCLLCGALLIAGFALPASAQQPQQQGASTQSVDPPAAAKPATADPKSDPAGAPKADPAPSAQPSQQPKDDRIFGLMPNYVTVENGGAYQPLSVGGKFKLTAEGSFDYFEFVLAAGLAGYDQATNEDRSWGQGAGAYAKRYGARFGDQLSGNIFVGAVYPSLFRTDPRYFRKGEGSFGQRSLFALSRIAVTKKDSGGNTINLSEFLGNATAAGLSNLYHPADERSASETVSTWATQLVIDAAGNELKEFWPDMKQFLRRKRNSSAPQ
jgi:hypothetical protein